MSSELYRKLKSRYPQTSTPKPTPMQIARQIHDGARVDLLADTAKRLKMDKVELASEVEIFCSCNDYSLEDVLEVLKPKYLNNNKIIEGKVKKRLKNGG